MPVMFSFSTIVLNFNIAICQVIHEDTNYNLLYSFVLDVLKLKMHVLVTHVVIRDNAKLLAMYVMCAHAMMALLAITVK